MTLSDWISIFMALIASASTLVTYIVYRSSTDPLIIVYANPDFTRPSLVCLTIKNIGKGAAYNINFQTSSPLPSQAFSIPIPEDMPDKMTKGPIINGIPFLAPDQQISFAWGQYGGLYKFIGDTAITVNCTFRRSGNPLTLTKNLKSISKLDIKSFEQSESSEHGFGPNIVKELKQLNKTLKNYNL